MGSVIAVCMSPAKHERKIEVDEARIEAGLGLVGDAHAGAERQVSLLAMEHIEAMKADLASLVPGIFAENLTTEGIVLEKLALGTRLKVGAECELQIIQIGKKCHDKCNIHKQVGYCIMPTKGVFARVLRSGTVRKGDNIEITGAA